MGQHKAQAACSQPWMYLAHTKLCPLLLGTSPWASVFLPSRLLGNTLQRLLLLAGKEVCEFFVEGSSLNPRSHSFHSERPLVTPASKGEGSQNQLRGNLPVTNSKLFLPKNFVPELEPEQLNSLLFYSKVVCKEYSGAWAGTQVRHQRDWAPIGCELCVLSLVW